MRFRAKYGNRKSNGFDSEHERRVFEHELSLLEYAGEITELKRQQSIELIVNGIKICVIKPDFTYIEKGKFTVHEAKGHPTRDWKIKWKLLKALHPEWEYRVS